MALTDPSMASVVNPVLLEVFKNRFSSIAEEMGVTLTQTAFSPNIKERRDLSCAIFDAQGRMVAQAAHIPIHLGSMPLSVQAVIAGLEQQGGLGPGDMAMLNDPFRGGTHLPDITVVAPVYAPKDDGGPGDGGGQDRPLFYVANRAHHADVGGMAPGSMPLSTSLFQEGLIIPPLKIIRAGELDAGLMDLILANVRTPDERRGDFAAQFMANTTGVRRLGELMQRSGVGPATAYAQALMDYAEAMTRAAIAEIPDGEYFFEDHLESDGAGTTDIPIRLSLAVRGDQASLDFTASADQVPGSVNAVRAITLSAVLYVFRCLVSRDIPANDGCLRPVRVTTRPGSVLDARFPAAVAGGNVETSQRVVDVVLGALAQALPGRIPAASQGTMNNLTMGGTDHRPGSNQGKPFAYYETLAGGMGAGPHGPGASAVHSHMTNTLNTPLEALEYAYPLRVTRFGLASHSDGQDTGPGAGGMGRHRGGSGLVREIEALSDCEVTVLSERRRKGPWGLQGGHAGAPGDNVLLDQDGPGDSVETPMPDKFHATLRAGQRIRITTPGGGGWGEEG